MVMVVMVMVVPRPLMRSTTPPREAIGRVARAATERFKRPGSR